MSGAFKPSSRGLGELLTSEEMKLAMREKADKIRDAAAAASPVGSALSDEERTRYKDSWTVEDGIKEGEPSPFGPNRRAYARVVNPLPYAAAIEWGNGRTDPPNRQRKTIDAHYTLTRAIDAARE